MKVELSIHDTATRQVVENVVTVVYTNSVAVLHRATGEKYVYPLVTLHRIREIPE